jgi:hypothetical protein
VRRAQLADTVFTLGDPYLGEHVDEMNRATTLAQNRRTAE